MLPFLCFSSLVAFWSVLPRRTSPSISITFCFHRPESSPALSPPNTFSDSSFFTLRGKSQSWPKKGGRESVSFGVFKNPESCCRNLMLTASERQRGKDKGTGEHLTGSQRQRPTRRKQHVSVQDGSGNRRRVGRAQDWICFGAKAYRIVRCDA